MGEVTATGGVLPFFRGPGCPRVTGFFSSPTLDGSSQLSGRSRRHLAAPGSIFRLPLSYSSFLGAFSSDSLNQFSALSASERFSESVRSWRRKKAEWTLRWGRGDWVERGALAAGWPDPSRADSEAAFRPHLQAARGQHTDPGLLFLSRWDSTYGHPSELAWALDRGPPAGTAAHALGDCPAARDFFPPAQEGLGQGHVGTNPTEQVSGRATLRTGTARSAPRFSCRRRLRHPHSHVPL